jgi:polyisoprenyl-phosphate glycosyltransferase
MTDDKQKNVLLSVVVPVYGCPEMLAELHTRLVAALETLPGLFEILLVNDACPAGSWDAIKSIASHDPRVKGIDLSRNFGQHRAITAGLDCALGAWVVVMDCDLQDRPEEIPRLYAKAVEGNDIVLGRRVNRVDSRRKKLGSRFFYSLLSYLTDTRIDADICNFGIYGRPVIDAIKSMREELRFFPLLVRWVGFKSTTVEIEHAGRSGGSSGYTFSKLMKLATDTMLAYSDKPLRITIQLGGLIAIISIIFAIYVLVQALTTHIPVMGWASLMVSIWFLAGLLIMILGMIGIYLGKAYSEAKDRPLYLIREKTGHE